MSKMLWVEVSKRLLNFLARICKCLASRACGVQRGGDCSVNRQCPERLSAATWGIVGQMLKSPNRPDSNCLVVGDQPVNSFAKEFDALLPAVESEPEGGEIYTECYQDSRGDLQDVPTRFAIVRK